ncbi:MAG: F0F1 ATP synthase subunit B [Planctomycetales bacterium]
MHLKQRCVLLLIFALACPCALVPAFGLAADEPEHKEDVEHGAKDGDGHDADGAHDDHASHPGQAGMAPPNLIAPNQDVAIYTFVVFSLLLAILWKFAWRPIAEGLDAREQRVADHIAEAEKLNADAKATMEDYQKKLLASQDEVRAIIEEAKRDAEHTRQEIVAKAEEETKAITERGVREVETAKAQALRELAECSADVAVELAGKLIEKQLSKDDHAELIDRQVNDAMAKFQQYNNPSEN